MARPIGTHVAGQDGWKDGQPTESNIRYAGAHYEEGKGWCNRHGEPIRMKEWDGERSYNVQTHASGNSNVPSGYRRVAMGVPCPISGEEDSTVLYTVDGKNAYWIDGDVYMRP